MLMVISAIKIQAGVRGRKARQDMATQHKSIHVLQRVGRGFLAKMEMRRVIAAVCTLQRAARIMITSMHNEMERFATTEIQRVWRGHRANTDFILMVISAIAIQAIVRGRQAGHDATIQRKAVSTLQRAARFMLNRFRSEVKFFAAMEIQRVWRGYRANVDFMLMVISAIKIQAIGRGRQARKGISSQHKSIRVLQRVGRGFLAKLEMRRALAAVTILQRAARVMIKRVNIEFECFASIVIQRIWRGYRANMDFMLIVVSAVTIQSFSRRILAEAMAKKLAKKLAGEAEHEQIERERALTKQRRMGEEALRLNGNKPRNVAGKFSFRKAQILSKPRHDETTGLVMQTSNQIDVAKSSLTLSPRAKTKPLSFSKSVPRNGTIPSRFYQAEPSGPTVLTASEVDAFPQILHIPSPQAEMKQSSKFEKHTTNAIRTLQTSNKFSEVLKAVMNLEKITQKSIEDCKMIVVADGQNKMFSIIRSCNRSSPHLELIRVILSVLTNLSQHPLILTRLANDRAIDALTDLVHMFRDKSSIFALSSSLLEKMLRSSHLLTSKFSTPENKKRLRGILVMSKKKTSAPDDMHKGIRSLKSTIQMIDLCLLYKNNK
mmetsp:Transcript_9989/g.17969  ORF Transcript_9989/g.17969 Transcript_9989/m.17969 type:complete len:604 (-) Transcript_9989:86-1897(-)